MIHVVAACMIGGVALIVSVALWSWVHWMDWALSALKGEAMGLSPGAVVFLVFLVCLGVWAVSKLVSYWREWKC